MRNLGLGLLFLGIVILAIGIIHSESVTEKVVEGVSGRPSHLLEYLVGALVLLIGGAFLILMGRDSKS